MRFGLRELIFMIVLLAVPVASWWYVFMPRNAEIAMAKIEVITKQNKLNKLQEVAKRIDDIGLAIVHGQLAVELIEAKLPNQQQVDVILQDVWQLADQNRLTVKSIKSEKPVTAAAYMEQPLKMKIQGRFNGFYQFLLELENLPRITRIHQMKMERMTTDNGSDSDGYDPGLMKAEFTLSIYFEQPPSIASAE